MYFLIEVALTGFLSFLVVYAIGKTLFMRDGVTPRIKALQERRAMLKASAMTPRRRERQQGINFIRNVVTKLKLLQQSQSGKLNLLLTQAGWRTKDAIYIFLFVQFVAPIVFFVLSFVFVKFNFSHPFEHAWKWLAIRNGHLSLSRPQTSQYSGHECAG